MKKWIVCTCLLLICALAACGKDTTARTEADEGEITEVSTGEASPLPKPETTVEPGNDTTPDGLTLKTDDIGNYYDGSIHDLARWAAQENPGRERILASAESYILLDVSQDVSTHFRYAVFSGETVLLDELKGVTPPNFSFLTENILRMTKGFGSNAMSVQYFDLATGISSRVIGHSGTITDFYDENTGTLLAAYYDLGARRPALLIEDMFTGYVMEVQRYFCDIIAPIEGLQLLDTGRLSMEYTDNHGTLVSEVVAIDLTPPSGVEDDAEHAEKYNIPMVWQTDGSNPQEAAIPSDQIIGFAIGFEYDAEAKTYHVVEDMGSDQVEHWEITNHSITIAVSNAFALPVGLYPGPSVRINERVFRFWEGVRYVMSTYYYGNHHEYESTESQHLITVYFGRDFEVGEIRDLHFVWGKLD